MVWLFIHHLREDNWFLCGTEVFISPEWKVAEDLFNEFCFIYSVQNSVNARYQTIQYPWLVFGEKVKVNTVFIRDSTGVSDSILILFGGKMECGATVISLSAIAFL